MNAGHAPDLAPRAALGQGSEAPYRHRLARRYRLIIAVLSIAAHVGILAALLTFRSDPPKVTFPDPPPIPVALVQLLPPPPPKAQAPEPPAPKSPAKPPPRLHKPPPLPAPPDVPPLPAKPEPRADVGVELTSAQLAGAASAGSGSGGGGACDVALWLQTGLRKDAHVQAALSRGALGPGSGRAVMVWNGDWVRSPGEDGAGLAVIREAIMMEILSAPAACRAQTMHGLILVSPSEAAGSVRLALGGGEWRWSELLVPRAGVAGHGIAPR